MKRHFRISASAWVGSVSLLIVAFTAFTALSQQRATPVLPGASAPAGQAAPAGGGARAQALPGTEAGWSTFQLRCASCHLNPAVDLATPGVELRRMTPEQIYQSLTTGSMNNSASPFACAFSRSRPLVRQKSFTSFAVSRLFAACGSLAFDLGALIVITERPPAFICFKRLLSLLAWNSTSIELLPLI